MACARLPNTQDLHPQFSVQSPRQCSLASYFETSSPSIYQHKFGGAGVSYFAYFTGASLYIMASVLLCITCIRHFARFKTVVLFFSFFFLGIGRSC